MRHLMLRHAMLRGMGKKRLPSRQRYVHGYVKASTRVRCERVLRMIVACFARYVDTRMLLHYADAGAAIVIY